MQGFICLWSGAVENIPAGWHLCDGTMGTPDLRDKFIIGAGGTHAVGDTGGSSSHDHDFTGIGHSHALAGGVVIESIAPNGNMHSLTTSVAAAGTVESKTELPPYYALAFIMKL